MVGHDANSVVGPFSGGAIAKRWFPRVSQLLLTGVLCLLSNSAVARDFLETYQLALQQDPVFQSQMEQFKGQEEVEWEALAGMLPTITASGTAMYTDMDLRYEVLGLSEDYKKRQNYYYYGVTLEQPIFVYEKWVAFDQADISVRRAGLQVKKNELDLMLRVSRAFFTAVQLKDDYESLLFKQSTLQSQSFYIQRQVDVGNRPKTELLQVKSSLEMTNAQVYSGKNRYQAALEELYMLTGEPYESVPKVDDSSIELLDITGADEGWLKKAQDHYLGIKIQKETVNLMEGEVELTKSGHYPSVRLFANYEDINDPGKYGYTGDFKKVTVLLSVPIFEGGLTLAQTRKAHHEWNSAKLELDYSRRDLKRNVSNALHTHEFLRLKQAATRTAIVESKSAFESIARSYRVGKSALIGLIKALDDVHLARLDHHKTVADLILNYLAFHSYVGDLSSTDIRLVNGLITVRN